VHGLLALLCFFLLTVHGWNLSNFILLHQIFRLYRKKNKAHSVLFQSLQLQGENLLWVLQIERHCKHFGKFGGEEDWKSFESFVD
jgi:hypothetical protein